MAGQQDRTAGQQGYGVKSERTAGQDSRTAGLWSKIGADSRTAGLWSKIGAEYKDAPKKLQQNTTTTVRSRNSMANGLVLKEKHIHSIDLHNIHIFKILMPSILGHRAKLDSLANCRCQLSMPTVEAIQLSRRLSRPFS